MKNSPSCSCCAVCAFADDDSPYEVCFGTGTGSGSGGPWTKITDGFQTSDSNAKMLFTPEMSPGSKWSMNVTVVVTGQILFGSVAKPYTYEFRIIGAAADCASDGVYAIFGRGADYFYTDLMGSRAPFTGATTCTVGRSVTTTYSKIRLCWDGTYLSVTSNSTPVAARILVTQNGLPGAGGRFGFATGTLVDIVDIKFTAVTINYGETAGLVPGNPATLCENCQSLHCCLGPIPEDLTLEISGVSSEIYSVAGCNGCQCTDLNGTYTLSAEECQGSGADEGEADCQWRFTSAATYLCSCSPFSQSYSVSILAHVVNVGLGSRLLRVQVSTSPSGGGITGDVATLVPCEDWVDWLPLTITGGPCNLGTATGSPAPVMRVKVAA